MAEFKKVKNAFDKLKLDPSSVAFAEEILDKILQVKLLITLKKEKLIIQPCTVSALPLNYFMQTLET